ncbi:AbrB/MazE/SpoVT family DNA-binding domain-containing protein [Myxococcota bacterium]|nr:AbrB/MazE/SpoVT family DNA-binding domain-containing protein [Myxococcota bacterium]
MRGYHTDMESPLTITIDAAGRLVIPAAVRRELAIVGGTELAVEVEGGVIHLRPTGSAALARRGRRIVVRSALTGPVPDHRDVRDERDVGTAGG